MKVSTRSCMYFSYFRYAGDYIYIKVICVGYLQCLRFPIPSFLLTIDLYTFNISPFLVGYGFIPLNDSCIHIILSSLSYQFCYLWGYFILKQCFSMKTLYHQSAVPSEYPVTAQSTNYDSPFSIFKTLTFFVDLSGSISVFVTLLIEPYYCLSVSYAFL